MALSTSPSSICCYLLFAINAFLSFGLITDPEGTLVDGFKMPGTVTVGMRHMAMVIGSSGMISCYLAAWASQSTKEVRKNCLMAMAANMPGKSSRAHFLSNLPLSSINDDGRVMQSPHRPI